ncbi:DUF3219 family protein [Peribacillus simplex]|uniref:DUF3219 family protein n=1 Tax=Peribacillus simplex TaxID=1478 RepID=UPI003D2BCD2E
MTQVFLNFSRLNRWRWKNPSDNMALTTFKGDVDKMVDEVILNDVPLHVTDFLAENVKDSEGREVRKVSFNFKVTNSEYHDITTLLYQMVFDLKIPQSNEEFRAEIFNYATSVTNLYEENAVGDFSLVLLEVNDSE